MGKKRSQPRKKKGGGPIMQAFVRIHRMFIRGKYAED